MQATAKASTSQSTLAARRLGLSSPRSTTKTAGRFPARCSSRGKNGIESPSFFNDSGEHAVENLYYCENGRFRQFIAPGDYDVIISRGPEYDAIFTEISVPAGGEAALTGTLRRVVDTTGYVSTEYHSHSSPSGDNTSSQFGRVLNLLCEHIEFAPCTEHNRIDEYVPHLQRLGVEHLMATCPGMELTGGPLPVNHQNAFPLKRAPHTQDGGAPVTDVNPVVQIERLAMWDDGADKLVQENHPNLMQILGDRDLNGEPDEGFREMFGFMDVVEVHPLHWILSSQPQAPDQPGRNNTIFNWMQLLNLGYRIPGVVNTDAHYNFHGSGWLRNYVVSSTDDPAEIGVAEMVTNSERGRLVMTTGPFMEVAFYPGAEEEAETSAGPGEDAAAVEGRGELHVRVQCPNWFDVDRVQVFVNGRPVESLNFRRRTHAEDFSNGVVRFEKLIPIELEQDAHLIVAAAGEQSRLGPTMGPDHENDMPIAVSNPIFVNVDGGGFTPNRDALDAELPIEE